MKVEEKIYSLFWELNYLYFGGVLPPIEIRFSTRLQTTGGQYFRQRKHMPLREKLIQLSTRYLQMNNAWDEVRDTLGHEMIHYWLDFLGRPCGHTQEFRYKLKACGFNRYSRLIPPKTRYIYMCSSCGANYHRKRHGIWSCGPCSGRKFNPRFKLVLRTII